MTNDVIQNQGIPEEVPPVKAAKIPIKPSPPSPPPQVRTTAPLPPPPPPPAIVPGPYEPRIKKVSRGAPKCIYFRDASQLDSLERLVQQFPRASVSSLIQQMVESLLNAAQAQPGERTLKFECILYL